LYRRIILYDSIVQQ